jgi:hypothetical protein
MCRFENTMQRSGCFHASKSEVIGSGIDVTLAACAHDVADAVLLVAEERAPLWTRFR